jgi:hypothetical protein
MRVAERRFLVSAFSDYAGNCRLNDVPFRTVGSAEQHHSLSKITRGFSPARDARPNGHRARLFAVE